MTVAGRAGVTWWFAGPTTLTLPLGGRMDIERLDLQIADIATEPGITHDVRWYLIDELLEWRTALASV